MLVTYTCEICGHTSDNQDEIERCEAQGLGHQPLEGGTRVLRRDRTWTVVNHRISKQNHSLYYLIKRFSFSIWVSENEVQVAWYSQTA